MDMDDWNEMDDWFAYKYVTEHQEDFAGESGCFGWLVQSAVCLLILYCLVRLVM